METSLQRGQYTERFRFIEILLAQNSVLSSLDVNGQNDLIRQVCLKYDEKNTVLYSFGIMGLQSSLLPSAKLLSKRGELEIKGPQIEAYLQTGQNISQTDTEAIYRRIKG